MTQYSYHTSLNLPFTSFNYLTQHFIHQKLSLAPFYNPLKQNLFFYPLTLFFPPNIANKTLKNLALRANIHLGKKIIFKQRGGENIQPWIRALNNGPRDPGCKHFFEIYGFIEEKKNFIICVPLFFAYFYAKN